MASSSCQRAHSCFQTKQANKTLFAPIQVPLSRYSSRKGFDFLHIIITISKHNNKKTTKNRDYIDAYFTLSSNRPLEHPAPAGTFSSAPHRSGGSGSTGGCAPFSSHHPGTLPPHLHPQPPALTRRPRAGQRQQQQQQRGWRHGPGPSRSHGVGARRQQR